MEEEKDFVGMADCFLCGEPKYLVLDRRMKKTFPKSAVYDKEPCDKCEGFMQKGIILIGVRDGESGDNPYRTGKLWVVKEEVVKRLYGNSKYGRNILKSRVAFIEEAVYKKLGLDKK